jgi:hypothetical protein
VPERSTALVTRYVDAVVFFIANIFVYTKYPRIIITYLLVFRDLPNIAKPAKLSEMVQWRKCFDKNPFFGVFVDKLVVKDWVASKIPNLNVPKTIWVGINPEDIPNKYLQDGFVLKTNHASGTNYFPHREQYSRGHVERMLTKWLSIDWYKYYSEWAYRSVKRKIFVEELIVGKTILFDLSVRAHNGQVSIASLGKDWKTPDQKLGYYLPDGSRFDDEFDFKSVKKNTN